MSSVFLVCVKDGGPLNQIMYISLTDWFFDPMYNQNRLDDGYGSEAGAPDDTDKPEDDALEFEKWRVRGRTISI